MMARSPLYCSSPSVLNFNENRVYCFLRNKELPEHLVPIHDATMWRTPMIRAFLAQWLGFTTVNPLAPSQFVHTPFARSTPEVHNTSSRNTYPTKAPLHQSTDQESVVKKQGTWRLHQPVKHATFGIGIVKEIEQKGPQTIITAQFRTGTKKIVSDFLTPL